MDATLLIADNDVRRRRELRRFFTAKYWIRLRIDPADREDAWDLFQAVSRYGGIEVRDGCFGFADKERWVARLGRRPLPVRQGAGIITGWPPVSGGLESGGEHRVLLWAGGPAGMPGIGLAA